MSSEPYDVVLLPNSDISQKALGLSLDLEKHGTYFTLNDKDHFPHLSLYMLQLDDAGLSKALDLLSGLADVSRSINATADHYHYSHDYLDVEYVKTAELNDLQENIIEKLNPIRDGLRERDKERLATTTGKERDNILKYGYRSVGNQFAPHLTFTRFKTNQSEVIETLPPPDTFSGTFSSLGIFRMGDHGTCISSVRIWSLG